MCETGISGVHGQRNVLAWWIWVTLRFCRLSFRRVRAKKVFGKTHRNSTHPLTSDRWPSVTRDRPKGNHKKPSSGLGFMSNGRVLKKRRKGYTFESSRFTRWDKVTCHQRDRLPSTYFTVFQEGPRVSSVDANTTWKLNKPSPDPFASSYFNVTKFHPRDIS